MPATARVSVVTPIPQPLPFSYKHCSQCFANLRSSRFRGGGGGGGLSVKPIIIRGNRDFVCAAGSHHNSDVFRIHDTTTVPVNDNELTVLGIETSCDDTAAAVVTGDGKILSQVVFSQSDLLVQYGGVAPKMAQEAHAQVINEVVAKALRDSQIEASNLSAVAVTIGPGLSLCLDVGVRKARQIARRNKLRMVGVHHMEAHALVARLMEKHLEFPFLVLLISGGHNLLVLARDVGQYLQLGTTLDDAIGEAYDKTAKLLGLDMSRSGGPAVEELAQEGNPEYIKFSVPMQQHKDCNFSFAGLKTQVRLAIESKNIDARAVPIADADSEDRQFRANIAASFQRVAVLHLEQRCSRAVEWAQEIDLNVKSLVVAGGVASNKYVRVQLDKIAKKHNLKLIVPPPKLCTDNGVMVAWTGIEYFRLGRWEPPPPIHESDDAWVDLRPRWQLGEIFDNGRTTSRPLQRARVHPPLSSAR